jgi:4-amino-4-deoxy-L-arabinose transferase-like glycosyltransferase
MEPFVKTSLEPLQFYLAFFGFLIALVSILIFIRQQRTISLILLIISAFLLRFMMASIDPFLHLWDEQFHALVAKNMLQNPFNPVLVTNPILPFDFKNWTENHIWLHKQPLYLWQMALSMKFFGVNEIALRLPSAIMSSLVVIFIYRIGKISINDKVGFVSAFLFSFSFMQLEIISGNVFTDHNDVAFLFYVSGSIWAFFEYLRSDKKIAWLIIIGLFAGGAVLVKWLTGLLIYAGWGILLLSNKNTRFNFRSYLPLMFSFMICLFIFLPWQLYIMFRFPMESAFEYKFSSEHFFIPIEGHGGTNWYHFDQIPIIYGRFSVFIILPALFLFIYKIKKPYQLLLPSLILFTYFFFTLAATKMPLFSNVVAPLIFILFGLLFCVCFDYIFKKRGVVQYISFTLFLIITAFNIFSYKDIKERHTKKSINYRNERLETQCRIEIAIKKISESNYVFFNCGGFHHVPLMFYSNNIAYNYLPTEAQIKLVKSKGYKLAVFHSDNLPKYILEDKEIFCFDFSLVNDY